MNIRIMGSEIIFSRNYKELIQLSTMDERFEYLKLGGIVGKSTFGGERYLNQILYTSTEWRLFRDKIIIRDNGCDMAMPGYYITPAFSDRRLKGREDYIIIHHINPLTIDDVYKRSEALFDPNNVVCVSPRTHRAIHYGDKSLIPQEYIERRPGDHCPWKMI